MMSFVNRECCAYWCLVTKAAQSLNVQDVERFANSRITRYLRAANELNGHTKLQ